MLVRAVIFGSDAGRFTAYILHSGSDLGDAVACPNETVMPPKAGIESCIRLLQTRPPPSPGTLLGSGRHRHNRWVLRDRNLVPLSHQHQHALALCVRIERGLGSEKPEPQHWQQEIAQLFESEIRYHFEAEEKVLFPFAECAPHLRNLVDELRVEHGSLRHYAAGAAAGGLSVPEIQLIAASLAAHVRKEERQLFEGMQEFFPAEELTRVGVELDSYFLHSGMPGASCALRPRDQSAADERR